MRVLRNQDLDVTKFDAAGRVTIYSFLSVLLLMIIIALASKNRGNCSYAIWHNINFLSLIHWIGLINIDDFSEFESFFHQMSKIFRPYSLPSICVDESIDLRIYQVMNINSNGFINNAKEMLIIYFTVLGSCLAIIVCGKNSKSALIQEIKSKIKYSIIIRLHILMFFDFMVYGMINVNFFTGKNTCSSVNLALSLFFLVIGGLWIMIIPIVIKTKMVADNSTHHDVLFSSISTIVGEFKSSFNVNKYQYYTIFLLYRFSLAFCLVVLPSSPSVQLFMILAFQFAMRNCYLVCYICLANPFLHKRDTITVFFSDFLCLVLIIFIGIRSLESISDNTKYYTSCLCVVCIWTAEFTIIIRYALSIKTPARSALGATGIVTSAVVPIEDHHASKTNYKKDKKAYSNFIFVESQETEHNTKEPKILEYKNHDGRRKMLSQVIEENKREDEIENKMLEMKKISLNTFSTALSHRQTSREQPKTDNAISVRQDSLIRADSLQRKKNKEEVIEGIKIKSFLKKVDETELKAGNRRLYLNQ